MKKSILIIFLIFIAGLIFSQDCYNASIMSPSPFMGNDGEIFKLSDGSIWEVKYEYEYLYEYYPDVTICPSIGELIINGKKLNVKLISNSSNNNQVNSSYSNIIESKIDGEFEGWEGETIFKLMNGQIWQQSSYAYTYSYSYCPDVLIIKTRGGYEMQVEGVSDRISVVRLK